MATKILVIEDEEKSAAVEILDSINFLTKLTAEFELNPAGLFNKIIPFII